VAGLRRTTRQQDLLLSVIEAVGVGIVVSDTAGTTLAANSRAHHLLTTGAETTTVISNTIPSPEGAPELVVATVLPSAPPPAHAPDPAPAAPGSSPRGGGPLPGELTVMPETPEAYRPNPLTDPDYLLRDRERAAALAERRFATTIRHSPVGFAVLSPGGEILDANPALSRILARPAFQLLGSHLQDFTHPDNPDFEDHLLSPLRRGASDSQTLERRYLRPRGENVWTRTTATALRAPDGAIQQIIVQVQDVTEIRLAEEALSHQSLHDPLTGLPNRTLMLDRIQQALDRTRRSRRRVAVLRCALDRFDILSDGVGHEHGDAVLLEVARRLERVLRSTDTAARLHGEQFAIICEDVQDEREAALVADRVLGAVREPMAVGARKIAQTVTIGIAVSSTRAADAVSLLRDAGTALHRAQQQGQNRWDIADDELRRCAVDRLDIEHALRTALDCHGLRVYFQPIVDLGTGRPVGYEALLRWQHPARGLLAPAWFLPVAEETGLIQDIGRWVLLEAARAAVARPDAGYVAVNVSASQVMRAGLVADVEAVLEQTRLPAHRLVVELTESVMLGAAPAGRQELHKLDDLGVRVVVDDFGTGFSALSYLRDLPVSGIKVDRSFTAGLGQDAQCERIVEALTGLAGGLGVDIVAEGVETERQRALLTRIGCQHAQGYLFGRPAPQLPEPATGSSPPAPG
jgi:diguanylate cyclase (GGDEF)-like protein/PAS domain S-box-containing protein